jgi:hypothetical protein
VPVYDELCSLSKSFIATNAKGISVLTYVAQIPHFGHGKLHKRKEATKLSSTEEIKSEMYE